MKAFRAIFVAVALLSAVVFVSAQSKETSKNQASIKLYLVAVTENILFTPRSAAFLTSSSSKN